MLSHGVSHRCPCRRALPWKRTGVEANVGRGDSQLHGTAVPRDPPLGTDPTDAEKMLRDRILLVVQKCRDVPGLWVSINSFCIPPLPRLILPKNMACTQGWADLFRGPRGARRQDCEMLVLNKNAFKLKFKSKRLGKDPEDFVLKIENTLHKSCCGRNFYGVWHPGKCSCTNVPKGHLSIRAGRLKTNGRRAFKAVCPGLEGLPPRRSPAPLQETSSNMLARDLAAGVAEVLARVRRSITRTGKLSWRSGERLRNALPFTILGVVGDTT